MWHRSLVVFLIIFLSAQSSYSAMTRIGFMGGLGFGSSSEESSYSESPIGTIFFFDYVLNSRSSLGVEHLRSWSFSPFATAVGFTNLAYKHYIGSGGIPILKSQVTDTKNYIHMKRIAYFLGAGVGFGQASVKQASDSDNASSVGLSMTVSAGLDYNLYDSFGVKSEFALSSSLVGTGSLSLVNLVLGVYFNF